ncbi:reverse transcriptase [Sphingobacterium sp. ML3W]|uniref:reverse transcriptase domain-containing protein n=1 Tax=Sphingobacterium sp. ML3W TaxID=1538644 RepID=UPI0004F5F91C|nr:reverse transcriptase domain-containing protein [Sphingobacterium sp. ML3W]AIM37412.1 reverse transcriptase [Sphingobacterium sp. ML3W]
MKRISNLYDQICSIDNILLADKIARKGKSRQSGVINFDKNYDQNIADIYRELITKTYKTSTYRYETIYEPKERQIAILPYRDRIVHHAIMNILEPVFVSLFTADTYSCIKGRGVHKASYALRDALKKVNETTYCLQLDIRKFYPSVDNDILKTLLRKKIKDKEMLSLLDGIIDSSEGLPIGNYLSQYLSNFYLTYMDHHIKEVLGIRHYFRYADDMIILHADKSYLHYIHQEISSYLSSRLKLRLKPNRGPFPVSLGIDFGGYKHYHTHTMLRKGIKKNFARAVKANKPKSSINSYLGWASHCDSKNFIKKILNEKL